MPFLLFCSLPLPVILAFVLCRGRRGTFARRVGLLLALAGCVFSLWASYWLFQGGQRAQWRSDGAGILFVMIAMVIMAVLGLVFGAILVASVSREDPDEEDRRAGFRAVLASLFLLFLALVAGWMARLYYRNTAAMRRVAGSRGSVGLLAVPVGVDREATLLARVDRAVARPGPPGGLRESFRRGCASRMNATAANLIERGCRRRPA